MQGPFSEGLNTAMFEMHSARYLVTKASSKIGGFEEKVFAAAKAGMTIIVIERPVTEYPNVFSKVEECVEKVEKLILG